MAGRVHRVKSPTGPESLFNLLPSASLPADQFDPVDNRGRLEFFPKLELELGEIRDEVGEVVRLSKICDVACVLAAGARDESGDRGDNKQVRIRKLVHDPFQLVNRVLQSSFRSHNQSSIDVEGAVSRDT